jgi:hypothetical protein
MADENQESKEPVVFVGEIKELLRDLEISEDLPRELSGAGPDTPTVPIPPWSPPGVNDTPGVPSSTIMCPW